MSGSRAPRPAGARHLPPDGRRLSAPGPVGAARPCRTALSAVAAVSSAWCGGGGRPTPPGRAAAPPVEAVGAAARLQWTAGHIERTAVLLEPPGCLRPGRYTWHGLQLTASCRGRTDQVRDPERPSAPTPLCAPVTGPGSQLQRSQTAPVTGRRDQQRRSAAAARTESQLSAGQQASRPDTADRPACRPCRT